MLRPLFKGLFDCCVLTLEQIKKNTTVTYFMNCVLRPFVIDKMKIIIILVLLTALSPTIENGFSQNINIHSVSFLKQTGGDSGYTLDGQRMLDSRAKALNTNNFGSSGIYPKQIAITDGYYNTGSLSSINGISGIDIFFFGAFVKNEPSFLPITNDEIDSLYKWSKSGGKLIIGNSSNGFGYDLSVLNSRWGYNVTQSYPSNYTPTTQGITSDIFNGPFGAVSTANQGGSLQGYFDIMPTDVIVLAENSNGQPTLILDCNTLDLISADIDGYTDLSGITTGATITSDQDRFWANTIVFMDKLQPLPVITNYSNTLSLNSTYNNYQWYLNNIPINAAINQTCSASENGSYYVEVTINGGCKVKSNIFTTNSNDFYTIPNVFTPNNDGVNDVFKIITKKIATLNCKIYDRWGLLISELTKTNEAWDGRTTSGIQCTTGVYYYTLTALGEDGKAYSEKGVVQLIK